MLYFQLLKNSKGRIERGDRALGKKLFYGKSHSYFVAKLADTHKDEKPFSLPKFF
jgi:hypothetical protein